MALFILNKYLSPPPPPPLYIYCWKMMKNTLPCLKDMEILVHIICLFFLVLTLVLLGTELSFKVNAVDPD